MNKNSHLNLRLFIECEDFSLAKDICESIKAKLSFLVSVELIRVEKYWKIPTYYTIYLKLKSNDSENNIFKKIISDFFPKENLQITDEEAIWNKWDSLQTLLVPETRWAQLEIEH